MLKKSTNISSHNDNICHCHFKVCFVFYLSAFSEPHILEINVFKIFESEKGVHIFMKIAVFKTHQVFFYTS